MRSTIQLADYDSSEPDRCDPAGRRRQSQRPIRDPRAEFQRERERHWEHLGHERGAQLDNVIILLTGSTIVTWSSSASLSMQTRVRPRASFFRAFFYQRGARDLPDRYDSVQRWHPHPNAERSGASHGRPGRISPSNTGRVIYVNGGIVIGNSASGTCFVPGGTPEPSTFTLVGLGLAIIALPACGKVGILS
jgi:hypothetical protein